MTTQEAVKHLTEQIKADPDLYYAYQANIAMAFVDCAEWDGLEVDRQKLHATANRAAKHFLDLWLKD